MSTQLRRLFAPELPIGQKRVRLPDEEARHATQVLRLRNHQSVEVTDGNGSLVQCQLEIAGKITWLNFEKILHHPVAHENLTPLIIEMAILKGEAMEWVVEKCVELGVLAFVPVITDHCVIQLDKKGPEYFRERWQRIADQSLKQCERLHTMEILSPVVLGEHLQKNPSPLRMVANENLARSLENCELGTALSALPHALTFNDPLRILVGPEGGFSLKETTWIQKEGRSFTLGKFILRAETAVIAATSIVGSFWRSAGKGEGGI